MRARKRRRLAAPTSRASRGSQFQTDALPMVGISGDIGDLRSMANRVGHHAMTTEAQVDALCWVLIAWVMGAIWMPLVFGG